MTVHELIVEANQIMWRNFSYERMLRAKIWAAKSRECPVCRIPPGFPCHNMSDVTKGPPHTIRANKWPHDDRVDWELLLTTLKQKGYR